MTEHFLADKIKELAGIPIKTRVVVKHYGVSYTELQEAVKNGTIDEERFAEAVDKALHETKKCARCYYNGRQQSCCYSLFHEDMLQENWVDCPRYLKEKPDYDERFGCGACKMFKPLDLFNGICIIDGKPTKTYRPSCTRYWEVV